MKTDPKKIDQNGFDNKVLVHYIKKGGKKFTDDELSSLGWNKALDADNDYINSETGDRRFYKTIETDQIPDNLRITPPIDNKPPLFGTSNGSSTQSNTNTFSYPVKDEKGKLLKKNGQNIYATAPTMAYGGKLPKYALGIDQLNPLNNAAQGLGSYVGAAGTGVDGRQTELSGVGSGALKGAGAGAVIGSVIPGVGTAIGAAAGGLIGGVSGFFGAKRKNKDVQSSEDAQAAQEAKMQAIMDEERQRQEAQQQLNYSRSYYAAMPSNGQAGSSIYAYGTSDIHIKKKNKGKFTAWADSHNMNVQEAASRILGNKDKYSSTLVKRANFAHNASGWKKAYGGDIETSDGSFTPVASNVSKVNGDSHEQGGVNISSKGQPIAEVEGDEAIINNQSVASDRIALPNGKTVAEESLRIGKQIGKNEKKVDKGSQLEKNTANRNISKLNNELADILSFQEQEKNRMGISDGTMKMYGGKLPKYAYGINPIGKKFGESEDYRTTRAYLPPEQSSSEAPYDFNINDYNKSLNKDTYTRSQQEDVNNGIHLTPMEFAAQQKERAPTNYSQIAKSGIDAFGAAVPYLDNAANLKLMSKAPQVPVPNMLRTNYATAMPMKTDYNINPALYGANKSFRNYLKNIDDNTSNSAISRGNKLGAFAKTLENKSSLYGQKENIETTLKNQDNQNRQSVSNFNAQNSQAVENTNLAKMDTYNQQKAARTDDLRRELSKNISNIGDDLNVSLYDRDRKRVYGDQVMFDALSKRDGSAAAQLIGSPQMNSFITDDKNYESVLKLLENQPLYKKKFIETYGKR